MKTIVFFDGVCGLCNHFVNFLMSHDKTRKLHYATLQGEVFKPVLQKHPNLAGVDSVMLFTESNGEIYTESTAALKTIAMLGGAWSTVKIFLVVPPFLRNFIYRVIAKNRYGLFGKKDVCRMPTPEERAYFLG